MPVKLLTTRFVETVKGNGVERVDYRDAKTAGLELRVSPSGRKSWSLLYRTEKGRGARRRRLALGDFPALDPEEARNRATILQGDIAKGADPAADQLRAAERVTVEQMGAAYIEKHAKRNKRSWKADEFMLKQDVYPVIGKLRPKEVERAHIARVTDRLIERGAPIQANRVFETMRRVFNWGLGTYLDVSPFYRLKKPTKEAPRERVLTRDELRIVWQRIERGSNSAKMGEPLQIAAKLLLLLAQRSSEVTAARKDELDLKAGVWVIPAERSKNGRAHRLPLPDRAKTLFARAIEVADEALEKRRKRYGAGEASPYVFPSPFGRGGRPWGSEPIGQTAVNHALQRVLEASGVKGVSPHDFRRTAATYMAELGIPEIHISAVLNHVRAGVTAKHYSRYTYEVEKLAALVRWQQELASICDETF